MPIFDRLLARWITDKKFKTLSHQQNKALLDTLTFAIAADGEYSAEEKEELQQSLKLMNWNSIEDPQDHINKMTEKLAELDDFNGQEALEICTDIGLNLEEIWLKEEAYYMAARIVCSDKTLLESERAVLEQLVKAFEIDSDRQETIVKKILNDPELSFEES